MVYNLFRNLQRDEVELMFDYICYLGGDVLDIKNIFEQLTVFELEYTAENV